MGYGYLVTELDGITDSITKIQRQKSSNKFYNIMNQNQNTEISNQKKNTNSYLSLHKVIPIIKLEEQNSWSQDDVLKC